MKLTKASAVGLCVALLLVFASHAESQDVLKDLYPGFSECAPAIFMPVQPGMTIKISNITYADTTIRGKIEPDTGMLKSFKEEISYAGRVPVGITVTVNLSKWTGMCSSLEYGVEVGGRTQVSPKYDIFDERKLPRTVAFSPEEPTGVIIGGGGPLEKDLVTEFGYDDKNRRQIRRQTFGAGGVTYEVSYSDYVYKGPPTGKMSSFAVRITAVAK